MAAKRLRFIATGTGFLMLTDRHGKLRMLELVATLPFNRFCKIESTKPGEQAGWNVDVSCENAPRIVATLIELLGREFDLVFCPAGTHALEDDGGTSMQLKTWLNLFV